MRKGFTLLELLSVMAIMGIVSTISIMGYFAVMRGSAARGAAEHLSQSIMLARQSAIMQGKKAYVVFDQDRTNSWYTICRYDGVITQVHGEWVLDEYAEWSDESNKFTAERYVNATMYNLSVSPPRFGKVKGSEVQSGMRWLKVYDEESGGALFGADQVYGWELYPTVSLPRGMIFGRSNTSEPPRPIIFNPDGTAQNARTIQIFEQVKSSGNPACTVIVDTAGRVEVNLSGS